MHAPNSSTLLLAAVILTLALPAASSARTDASISDVAERTVVSVVNISAEKVIRTEGRDLGPFSDDPMFRRFFGPGPGGNGAPRERREQSLGSGVIVDGNKGIVLTNSHVIEKTEGIRVTLSDGRSFDATIVGTDPESDLGVLRITDPPGNPVPLPFGDSDSLRLGSTVLAIGNPFGVGQTVTLGIVSAIGRANLGIVDYEDFIQTDAAINPGNSGGALIDTRGELVGINTAILSRTGTYQGIGFAIPSNMAKGIMQSLIADGKVTRGWLGVAIQDLTRELAAALDAPADSQGALVSDVVADSPAAKAGLETGDLIVRFDGAPVEGGTRLRHLVAAAGAKKVKVEIIRDGKEKTLTVTLGEREQQTARAEAEEEDEPLGGLHLRDLTPEISEQLGVPAEIVGILVARVEPGSVAARAGFRRGDLILEASRKKIATVAEFQKVYNEAKESIAVLVQRGPGRRFLVLPKE